MVVYLDIPGWAHVEPPEDEKDDGQDEGGDHDPRPYSKDHRHDPHYVQCDLTKTRIHISVLRKILTFWSTYCI